MKETKKFKGIHWTKMPNKEDILERMRQKKIGKRMSDETKEKISDSQKRIGNKPPNWKGKRRSQHHKDSVSAYLTGRPRLDMRGPQNPLWKDGISKDIKTYAKNYELNKKEKLAGRKISEQCEICGIPASELSRRLSYDHNHVTGVFQRLVMWTM